MARLMANLDSDTCSDIDLIESGKKSKQQETGAIDEFNNAANDHREATKFWNDILKNDRERHTFVRATEEMPEDILSGLGNAGRKIQAHASCPRSCTFMFLVLRISLNVWTSTDAFLPVLRGETAAFETPQQPEFFAREVFGDFADTAFPQQSKTEMREHSVIMCEEELYAKFANHSEYRRSHCLKAKLARLRPYKYLTTFEFVTISLFTLISLIASILFMACKEVNQSTERFLFVCPKLASKFSAISCLQYLNFNRLESLIVKNEVALLFEFTTGCEKQVQFVDDESVQCETEKFADDETSDASDEERPGSKGACCAHRDKIWWKKRLRGVLAIILYVILICISFQALLVKMTELHFASVRSFYTWGVYEWLCVLGFVNQLAGACFVEEIEIHRVLLMKFGGAGGQWEAQRRALCIAWLHFFARKITADVSRLYALMLLTTITSSDLQKVLLSDLREKRTGQARRLKYQLFEGILKDSDSGSTPEEASQVISKRRAALIGKRDELIANSIEKPSTAQFSPGGTLFLAARVQSLIDILTEVAEKNARQAHGSS